MPVDQVDGRACREHLLPLARRGPHQAVQIARLELVRMLEQQAQVRHAVVAAAGGEHLGRGERHQRGVAAGAAAGDGDAAAVGETGLGQMPRARRAIGDVGDAPGAVEALAVGAAVAGAAGVVDVEHGEAAAGVELDAHLQAGVGHGRGAAVHEDERRRSGPCRTPVRGALRRVVDAVHRLPVGAAELAHLALADEARLDLGGRRWRQRRKAALGDAHDRRRRSRPADQRGKAGAEGNRIVDACGSLLQLRILRDLAAFQFPHLEQRHAAPQRHHADLAVGVQRVAALPNTHCGRASSAPRAP